MFTIFASAASALGDKACSVSPDAIGCGATGLLSADGFVFNAINTVIFIIGALSVVMIVIGGLRYVLSGGDSAGLKSAKDTIMYALIGVAVAVFAYALVAFVISRFS